MSFGRATRRGLTAAALLVTALAGRSAAAAGSAGDRAAARQHLSQAEELKKHGRLTEACKHVEEGERLDPQLPTLLELAECTEQLGKLVEAQSLWALARDRAKHDEKPQSRARAEARLAAVQKRVAQLTLQLANAPAGVQVLRDDVPLEPASLAGALPTDPGDHVIVVKLAGHDDAKYAVTLASGAQQTLAIAVGPASAAQGAASVTPPPAPIAAAPSGAPPSPSPSSSVALEPTQAAQPSASWWTGPRTAGVILGSAGIVGIGLGSALCVIGKRDADRRGSTFDERLAFGGISLATGGVLLLTSAVLFASAPSDESHQHARVTVSPTVLVAHRAAVLGAAGEF
jgi:hypothetical protein